MTVFAWRVGQAAFADALWRGCGPAAGATLVHAGGVLEDALLPKQTLGSLRRVFAPKLAGLRNLAGALAAAPPAAVALFSSIASLLGSPGQGNYAAANAALDSWALAAQRQVIHQLCSKNPCQLHLHRCMDNDGAERGAAVLRAVPGAACSGEHGPVWAWQQPARTCWLACKDR